MAVSVEIKGLQELQREQERIIRELAGAPMLEAMRDSTLTVQRYARQNAPWDTGRLRASILPEVQSEGKIIMGIVGSNVEYAPYQEFGTGAYAMYPTAKSARMSGGIQPRLYLTNALKTAEPAIIKRFERAVTEVIR